MKTLTLKKANEMMEKTGGSLDLRGTQITTLPDGLTVGGSLDLRGTQITTLPDGLTVGGWLDLRGTQITTLPDGLTVGGSLYLRGTQITTLPDGLTVGGWLDLRGTQITTLPDGLTVGGSLDLSGTQITTLPDGLTVGGWLDLRGTQITTLPDGLTVGGSLDLRGTQITTLPDGLTVGGSLYLSGTQITTLPDGLTVGGSLYLRGTQIKLEERQKVKQLIDGTINKKYIYADGHLFLRTGREHKIGEYTVYQGKIKGQMLVTDGKLWAHCKNAKEGIADILFKRAKDRGADQYKGIDIDKQYTVDELKTMYRIITGACRAGTEAFVNSVRDLKETYTVREALEITQGQYNSGIFSQFFATEDTADPA